MRMLKYSKSHQRNIQVRTTVASATEGAARYAVTTRSRWWLPGYQFMLGDGGLGLDACVELTIREGVDAA